MIAMAAALYRRTSASVRSNSAPLRACRSSRMGVVSAKTSAAVGPFADAGDDPAEVLRIPIELDLMVPVGLEPFQVVQAAVQMHDVGLLPEDPLVEVGEHVGAVAAVLRRADDDSLARRAARRPGAHSRVGSNRRRAPPRGSPGRGRGICLAPCRWARRRTGQRHESRITTPGRIARLPMRRLDSSVGRHCPRATLRQRPQTEHSTNTERAAVGLNNPRSGQDSFDDLTIDVRQPEVAACIPVGQLGVVEAE